MKRTTLVVAFLLAALLASAQNLKVVGTFHVQKGDARDATCQVWSAPSGIIDVDTTVYTYEINPQERDQLIALVQKAAHYCQVAADNKTTIDFWKEVGEFTSDGGPIHGPARFVVQFYTSGWDHSGIRILVFNDGRNMDMTLTPQDVNEMARVLSSATDYVSEYNRQAALFN